MKFLCDAHITKRVMYNLRDTGYESFHVIDLLHSSKTKDSLIAKFADENDLIIISKDSDFRDSFFIQNTPKKLILEIYLMIY